MAMTKVGMDEGWVPQACTLPTAQQPLRMDEFDALFTTALREVQRIQDTRLRLMLKRTAEVEATTRDLAERESQCCSLFTFSITLQDEVLLLDVEVPVEHADVLGGLATRARGGVST